MDASNSHWSYQPGWICHRTLEHWSSHALNGSWWHNFLPCSRVEDCWASRLVTVSALGFHSASNSQLTTRFYLKIECGGRCVKSEVPVIKLCGHVAWFSISGSPILCQEEIREAWLDAREVLKQQVAKSRFVWSHHDLIEGWNDLYTTHRGRQVEEMLQFGLNVWRFLLCWQSTPSLETTFQQSVTTPSIWVFFVG